jgi:hypothetical protein
MWTVDGVHDTKMWKNSQLLQSQKKTPRFNKIASPSFHVNFDKKV